MTKLERLAEAIQWYEGWFPLSHSWRFNNPGNLRWSKFQEGQKNGFAYFSSYASGWLALWYDLACKCDGNTRTRLGPTSTIFDLFEVWAPASDNNNPTAYAIAVADRLKISPDTQLGWFLNE